MKKHIVARVAAILAARFFPKGKKLAAGIIVLVLPLLFIAFPGTYNEFLSIAEWVVANYTAPESKDSELGVK